jgi:hypothetical protein
MHEQNDMMTLISLSPKRTKKKTYFESIDSDTIKLIPLSPKRTNKRKLILKVSILQIKNQVQNK